MMLQRPTNPVENTYNGDTLSPRLLREYCNSMNANMTSIEHDIHSLRELLAQEKKLNAQLADFAAWVVSFNPNALHEYKAVNTVITSLEGRDNNGANAPLAGP